MTPIKASVPVQRAIQIEGGADERQMREGLREIAQGLSAVSGFLRVKA